MAPLSRRATIGLAAVSLALAIGVACGGREPVAEPAPPKAERVRRPPVRSGEVTAPPVVVLVVLDTVRSSHLSLCGYDRPTSPFLEELVTRGAAWTCDAYAPATWTLPSHATFFSGLGTTAHDLLKKGLSLPDEVDTLADRFAAAGYQTLLLSANPVIKAETGLQQGFERVVVARGLTGPLRGDGLAEAFEAELGKLDATRPLFAVVNVFDAHDPYPAVPHGVDWVPRRPELSLRARDKRPDNPFFRYVTRKMAPAEEQAWLAHVVDTYDWGVSRADRSAARVLKALKTGGWLDDGYRLVVTSDHGENLGEHDIVGHDGPPWESVARVPFLVMDTTVQRAGPLPAPLSGDVVFTLLSTGSLPDAAAAAAPTSFAVRKGEEDRRFRDAVALWPGPGDKLMWMEGKLARFDLTADPESPLPLEAHEALEALRAAVAELEVAKARVGGKGADPDVVEMLERLGYAE